MRIVRKACPHTPLVLYINGNGGLLERMKGVAVDVIGLDWTVDMADGRKRLGGGVGVQGNVDPAYLFSPLPVLTDEIHRCSPPSPFFLWPCISALKTVILDCFHEIFSKFGIRPLHQIHQNYF